MKWWPRSRASSAIHPWLVRYTPGPKEDSRINVNVVDEDDRIDDNVFDEEGPHDHNHLDDNAAGYAWRPSRATASSNFVGSRRLVKTSPLWRSVGWYRISLPSVSTNVSWATDSEIRSVRGSDRSAAE